MSTTSTPPANQGQLRPTIYIGLGGSGRAVLMMLRKRLLDQHRSAVLPFTRFLAFDTHSGRDNMEKDDWTEKQIALADHEQVMRGLNSNVVNNYYNNPGQYPHIMATAGNPNPHAWFDLDTLRQVPITAVDQGAGQVRSFGRLAFFHAYTDFEDRLKRAIRELKANDMIEASKRLGFQVDPTKLEVVIVSSLAGGTGSGCFLDVAYAAHHLVDGECSVNGFFFLPSAYANVVDGPSKKTVFANGYAAMRELEYFYDENVALKTKNTHRFSWRSGEVVSVAKEPFNCVYLLESNSAAEGNPSYPIQDLYRMTADFLALYVDGSSFGDKQRQGLSNVLQAGHNKYEFRTQIDERTTFVQRLNRRYFSVGMAQIRVDQAKMANAAAYRLGAMMLEEHWLRRRDPGHELSTQDLPELLTRLGLDWQLLSKDLQERARLEQQVSGVKAKLATIQDAYFATLEKVKGDAEANYSTVSAAAEVARKALAELGREAKQNVDRYLGPSSSGTGARAQMGELSVERLDQLEAAFQRELLSWLQNPWQQGVAYAERMLQRLQENLEHAAQEALNRKTELMRLQASHLELMPQALPPLDLNRVDKAEQKLQEAEALPDFPWRGAARHLKNQAAHARTTARRGVLEQATQEAQAFFGEWEAGLVRLWNHGAEVVALELLADPDRGVLPTLQGKLGQETVVARADGASTTQRTGLRLRLGAYVEALGGLAKQCRALHENYARPDADTLRDVMLMAQMDYGSEVPEFCKKKRGERTDAKLWEKLWTSFFESRPHLIQRNASEETSGEQLFLGMQSLFQRAADAPKRPLDWEQVTQEFVDYLHEETREFKADEEVWQLFQQCHPDKREREDRMAQVTRGGMARLRINAEGYGSPNEPHFDKKMVVNPPGTPDLRLEANSVSAHPFQNADAVASDGDRIVFMHQLSLLPLHKVVHLRDLRRDYDALADGSHTALAYAKAHTRLNRDALPDILPPSGDEGARYRLKAFRSLVLGLACGVLKCEAGAMMLRVNLSGMVSWESLGTTLSAGVMVLERPVSIERQLLAQLERGIQDQVDRIESQGESDLAWALVLDRLVRECFPRLHEVRAGSPFYPIFEQQRQKHMDAYCQRHGIDQIKFGELVDQARTDQAFLDIWTQEAPLSSLEALVPIRVMKASS